MLRNKSLSRWSFILASIIVISLILWNTYIFFNQLKENERAKMEIWAAAYNDFILNNPLDAPVGEVIPIIIQGNTTTPMILYTYKEKVYTEKNIDSSEVNTLEKKRKLV